MLQYCQRVIQREIDVGVPDYSDYATHALPLCAAAALSGVGCGVFDCFFD